METPQATNASWRIKKYYLIKSPESMVKKLYYSAGILISDFGYNVKTLRNGISKFATGASKYYQSFRDGGAIMIDHDTIPKNSRGRRKLPATAQAAYDKLIAENIVAEDINKEAEFKQLKQTFEDLYHNQWPRYLRLYELRIKDRHKQILFAKAHSLLHGILTCMKSKWPGRILFEAYRQIMVEEIDGQSQPVFYTFSYVYFLRKLSLCRTKGIPETLVHEMLGEPREYRRKMTGQVIAFIRILFRDPRRFTISAIVKKVLRRYKVDLSPSAVKTLKRNSLDRNVLEYDANGVIHSRQNGLPKITRFLAEAAGDQFQGDWYKLQFFCRRNRLIIRLWAYVVLDVYSKKVVGWALAEEPSATQAKHAFKMALKDHSLLPEEIVIDNDPIYKRKIFKRFCSRLNKLGVITTKAYANIPTWKAEIESFFAVFQKLHSDKPWFIGEGIRSKNEAGNPSIELRKKLYKDKTSMLTEKEMHIEFAKMIIEYNAITNDRRKTISPNDTFRMNPSKRTQPLQDWVIPFLFWKVKPKKRIKDDGRIDLQIDRTEYCYQVTKAEMLWMHKNTDIRMCYDPNDMSKIYIFERFTHKFIGVIEPRMVMTRNNKKEVMKKQRKILRDAQQYLRDGRLADNNAVNGISKNNRKPVSAETLADKLIRRRMKLRKLEQQVENVPIHP